MRKFSSTAQKVFNYVKTNPGLSIYGLAKALNLDYKSTYVAVALLEQYELLRTESKLHGRKSRREVFVPNHAKGLDICQVQIESGKRLMDAKAKRRKKYFELHGSMKVSKTIKVMLTPTLKGFD